MAQRKLWGSHPVECVATFQANQRIRPVCRETKVSEETKAAEMRQAAGFCVEQQQGLTESPYKVEHGF